MESKWKKVLVAGLLGVSLGMTGCVVYDRPGHYGHSDRTCRDSRGHRVECRNYGHDDRRHDDRRHDDRRYDDRRDDRNGDWRWRR